MDNLGVELVFRNLERRERLKLPWNVQFLELLRASQVGVRVALGF